MSLGVCYDTNLIPCCACANVVSGIVNFNNPQCLCAAIATLPAVPLFCPFFPRLADPPAPVHRCPICSLRLRIPWPAPSLIGSTFVAWRALSPLTAGANAPPLHEQRLLWRNASGPPALTPPSAARPRDCAAPTLRLLRWCRRRRRLRITRHTSRYSHHRRCRRRHRRPTRL